MGSNFEDFGIERPIVEVSDGAFEEGRHACVAGLNVPVMTRVVCIWPRYSDQAHEMTDWKILRMLVQQLAYLWPLVCQLTPPHLNTEIAVLTRVPSRSRGRMG
jgi:hypothetical protein